MSAAVSSQACLQLHLHIDIFEQLNLTKYMHSEGPELQSGACLDYDLVDVIVHCGETFEDGHYFSYCRRQAAGGSPGSSPSLALQTTQLRPLRTHHLLALMPLSRMPLPLRPISQQPLSLRPISLRAIPHCLVPAALLHAVALTLSVSPQTMQQPAVATSSAGKTEAEVFQVEQILDHKPKGKKRTDRKVRFLIKWVGYGQERNSWESYRNLEGGPDALKDYWAKLDSPKAVAPSPEDPPASPVASQLGARPPASTTTMHTPAHPTHRSSLPSAAAPTTHATDPSPHAVAAASPSPHAPASPLCFTGVVPHPPALPPCKPTTTSTRSGSQRPAASSPAGLLQAKAPAASTHRAPTNPLATSSAALCWQSTPGASTQAPPISLLLTTIGMASSP
ncbi:M-phase phosphoprotein 8 [Trebouxia sp. C0010 RCD-2024]